MTAVCALAAGSIGWLLASHGMVILVGPLAEQVPANRHVPFLANVWAHSASYLTGFAGGLVLTAQVWRSRGQADWRTNRSPSV